MKKVFFLIAFATIALGFSSCDCHCYQDTDGSPTICKEDYEGVWGAGTWSKGASEYRAAGWKCQN